MKKLVLSLVLVGAFGFASAQEAPKEHHCRHSEHKKMEREKDDKGKRLEELNLSNKQNSWKNSTKSIKQKRKNFMRDISENSKKS